MMTKFASGLLAALLSVSAIVAQETKQPQPKSQAELEAIQAMFQAQDPDARIKAAEQLIIKCADTEFKSLALYLIAASYEQKGDATKMMAYAERTLEADPKNYMAMLMLAGGIAKGTREHDLDKEEKLARSDKYAKSALETLKTAPKPNPNLTDDQWTAAKKDYEAQAYEAFGLAAMVRKNYEGAVKEFSTSVTTSANPDPATMVRLAQAQNLAGKPDDALATIDKLNAIPDLHPQIKQVAQAERVRAIQAKGGGAKPAEAPKQ
jgi:tetratricopeptide (TPR) repeat protein